MIEVNGIKIDRIYSHYKAIGVLIEFCKLQGFAGQHCLCKWDLEREKERKMTITESSDHSDPVVSTLRNGIELERVIPGIND